MGRRSRFHLSQSIYHVMLRGNDGQSIFFEDADRCKMCLLIQEGVERFGHRIHSFCFMTNHIHLAIQVGEVNISRIIQNLAFRYARYINKKHKRIGHLFQGRFKSVVIGGDRYLKELIRYIHLNPVRAGIVNNPLDYAWCSQGAYVKLAEFSWLTLDHVLKSFGPNRSEAIVNYDNFLMKGIGIELELDFKTGCNQGILGDEEFVDQFFENVDECLKFEISMLEIVESVSKKFDLSQSALRAPGKKRLESHARAILALLVREENLSLEELGEFLERDPSGLRKLAHRLERKCSLEPFLKAEIHEFRNLKQDIAKQA